MPSQNQETQTNSGDKKKDLESTQASTGTEVREGQENSSINHDEVDENRELEGPVKRDDNAVNQEEFIEDRNTKKEEKP